MLKTMKGKKALPFFIACVAIVLLTVGCGSQTGENVTPQSSESNPESGQVSQGSGPTAPSGVSATYRVEHAMEATELTGTPERVVVLTNEGTEALLSMGVKPVGAVQSWLGDPWYEHIQDQMAGVEVVGTESDVNLEAIAALQPDLIIGNKLRQEKIYSQLKAIAPTVFSETLKGDWKVNFSLYAKALNREEIGGQVMRDFDKRIEVIKGDLGNKVNTEISVVRFLAGAARIYYRDTFSGVVFDQIGFKRPPAQDKNEFAEEVTKERIPEMEGDILFYFTYEKGDGEASKTEQEWTKDPLWNQLEVVKKGKAYKVNDAVWNTAGGVIAANLLLDDLEQHFID